MWKISGPANRFRRLACCGPSLWYAIVFVASSLALTALSVPAAAQLRGARERFLHKGPWRVKGEAGGDYRSTESADPIHLYHDVLVSR